jgi:hypothetical protein
MHREFAEMINSFILRIMDMDITWVGLQWLRPQKDEPISWKSALIIAGITSLFAVLAGPLTWFLFFITGEAEAPALAVLAGIAAVILNTALQVFSAWCWNHRASRLHTLKNDLS